IQCNSQIISETGEILGLSSLLKKPKELFFPNTLNALLSPKTGVSNCIWDKLWKKELFLNNNLSFEENVYYDDFLIVSQYLIHAKKVLLLPQVYYYYLKRDGSITGSYTPKHIEDYFYLLNILKEYIKSQSLFDDLEEWYNAYYRKEFKNCVNKANGHQALQT